MTDDERTAFRRRLLERLYREVPQDQADRLFYHLGDLHDAFAHSLDVIGRILDSEAGSKSFRDALSALGGELLTHIPMHLAEVAPDLEAWRDRVYDAAEERGEL